MPETPLPNDPSARTETGELKPVQNEGTILTSPTSTETSTTESKPEQSESSQTTTKPAETPKPATEAKGKPSVLNEKQNIATGAPEKYEPFKPPEGFEYDAGKMEAVNAKFKDMNLSQAQGQELMDLYGKELVEAENGPYKLWEETQQKWRDEIKADPELVRLDQVKTTVARAIDGLGDPKLAREFREAMDFTGAGNNPAFIRAFYRMAQRLSEGGPHPTGGPSPAARPGAGGPVSIARAMYPKLPSVETQ